ncbi:hypothetical protein NYG95_08265 [Campylobacter felis]|uniref:Lipoprotein n=1 Tax=Campylobacter felis TaxID=2974565 RepID=A0ABT7I5K4_9BACT|nr:hypothetical protein [Campylobacter upsaliensis]MDL0104241.1 hypothetical protein [Campylobacter felis]MDL0109108.1 hypothetical protein [Campylobacter felis]MDL0147595.1 hypothetical protein [Campylobacter felis]
MLWLVGCGSKTQSVKDVKLVKVQIPSELLELKTLPKPYVNNEIEILNAYSMLFYHYKQCVIQMGKIRELSE